MRTHVFGGLEAQRSCGMVMMKSAGCRYGVDGGSRCDGVRS